MARKNVWKKTLAVFIAVIMVVGMLQISAMAAPGRPQGGQSGSSYEYIQISVNGSVVETIKGANGNHTWLV